MNWKAFGKGSLKFLWQFAPWLADRIKGKKRSPEEMRADLNKAKRKANEDVQGAIDDKFGDE